MAEDEFNKRWSQLQSQSSRGWNVQTVALPPALAAAAAKYTADAQQQQKSRSNSVVSGVSTRPIPSVSDTTSKLERLAQETREQAEEMRRRFEATKKAANTRWMRKGDPGAKILTGEQVNALISQGADPDEFYGAPASKSEPTDGLSPDQQQVLQELDDLAKGVLALQSMDLVDAALQAEKSRKQQELDEFDKLLKTTQAQQTTDTSRYSQSSLEAKIQDAERALRETQQLWERLEQETKQPSNSDTWRKSLLGGTAVGPQQSPSADVTELQRRLREEEARRKQLEAELKEREERERRLREQQEAARRLQEAKEAERKQRLAEAAAHAEKMRREAEEAAQRVREQVQRAEEEARKRKLEAEMRRRQEEEEARKRAEQEAQRQKELERLRKLAEEEAERKRQEEELRRKAAEEAERKRRELEEQEQKRRLQQAEMEKVRNMMSQLTARYSQMRTHKIVEIYPGQRVSQKMMIVPTRANLVRVGTSSTKRPPQDTASEAPTTTKTSSSPSAKSGSLPISTPATKTPTKPTNTTSTDQQKLSSASSPNIGGWRNTLVNNPQEASDQRPDNSQAQTNTYPNSPYGGADNPLKSLKMTIKVSVPQISRSFECIVELNQSIATFKQYVWTNVLQAANIRLRGTPADYILRAEVDDMLTDETLMLYETPYFKFCAEHKLLPVIHVVGRHEIDAINKTIEQILGGPRVQNEEAESFRNEMQRVMNFMMMTTYRKVRISQHYTPGPSEEKTLPQAFNVHFFVPEDRNPNDGPTERRSITVKLHTTATQVIEQILSDYPYLFVGKPESASDYVLKLRGLEEYLFSDMKLISIEYLRNCLRKRKPIDFVVIERDKLSPELLQYVAHYEESRRSGKQNTLDLNVVLTRQANLPARHISHLTLNKPLRVLVRSVDRIPFDPKLFNASKKRVGDIYIFVTAQVFIGEEPIGPQARTSKHPYPEDESAPITFDQHRLELAQYSLLPRASLVRFEVHAQYKEKDTVIAWCNKKVFDCDGVIRTEPLSPFLWLANQHELLQYGPLVEEGPSTNPKLHCAFEDFGTPVVFLPFNYQEWKAANGNRKVEMPPPTVAAILNQIIARDALQRSTRQENELLWRYRDWAKTNPLAAARVMAAVPWNTPGAVQEAYRLLHEWVEVEPIHAIEMLNKNFLDPQIRAFAVRNLHRMSDEELSDILLQLVQALKHELYHDSALARFLITRAVFNQTQIGNYFFWHLKSCQELPLYKERFDIVLEVYLRHCSTFRENLRTQNVLFNKLKAIAIELKSVKAPNRKAFLEEKLNHLSSLLPPSFQFPTNCSMVAKGFRINKCKYLDSKTLPLWIVGENVDALGDPLSFIFKVGDDLRQDQLTVQMFKIMDKLWRQAGLDLKMSPYTVLDAGKETGMIEVVPQSATNAAIQKQYGGLKAAFSEKPLYEWLKKHNPNEADLKSAVRDFARSCAGYCVATYVLGIGDRHNDNIMCTKSGHLFHIDFGRFLGNAEKFAGVSRDRAPFVFTPEFAYAMGGVGSSEYNYFVTLCCAGYNVLRKHANIFINLFAMMLSTGIPELRSEEDINYLREAFSLEMTDEEASKKFERLIEESLKTKATQLNFMIHIMAHPEKE